MRISVMARCAATPSTCDNANPVPDWTSVAAAASSASGTRRSPRSRPMTSSTTYPDIQGITRPASRLISINTSPSPSR